MACVAVGVGMATLWAGVLVAGVELLVLGIAMEVRKRNHAG